MFYCLLFIVVQSSTEASRRNDRWNKAPL